MVRFAFLTVMFAVIVGFTPAGYAQSRQDVRALETKLDQLERQLRAVQRRVFDGEGAGAGRSAKAGSGDAGAALSKQDRTLLVDLSVKMDGLQRQISELTGRLEELEFKQRQNNDRMDSIRREMELRFKGVGAATVAQPSTTVTDQAPVTQTAPSTAPTAGVPQAAATEKPAAEVAVTLPDGTPAQQYDFAFNFVRANDLTKGRIAFEKFLEMHGKDKLVPNALFWLGRIHLREKQEARAAQYLLRLIDEHPGHNKRPDALVDLAEVLVKLDSASDACDALLEFRKVEDNASSRLKSRAERLRTQAKCRG